MEIRFLYLKIVRQYCGIARKASDTVIGVLKQGDVKFPAASWNRAGNFTDLPEESQLLEQPQRDSTTDVTDHDRLARLDSKCVSRIDAQIRATDDNRLYTGQCSRE